MSGMNAPRRLLRALGALLVLSSSVLFARESRADCDCPVPADTLGVVWQGKQPLTLRQVAELVAPVLEYSPDEPMFRRAPAIPSPHPCDRPASGAVVYYQTRALFHRGAELPLPLDQVADFSDRVRTLYLRFFFYYPEDMGTHGHRHDVEGVEMEIDFERVGDCRLLRLDRTRAFAHGAPEYENRLRTTEDTRVPVALLVEEGKHASCTDRNGDGVYTPAYDTNERVRDAWGVRDIFGSGYMLGSAYAAKMTKPRREADRVLPPEPSAAMCATFVESSYDASKPSRGRYELRAGDSLDMCPDVGTPAESTFFARGMMIANGFGVTGQVEQFQYDFEPHIGKLRWVANLVTSTNLVLDEGQARLSFTGRGLDIGEGWIVPRAAIGWRSFTADLVFTPSAVVWVSPYASLGYEHHRLKARTLTGAIASSEHRRDEFASELGLKLRFSVPPGRMRVLSLGQRFGGLRFGVRMNGFERIRTPRFIVAIGGGHF